MIYDAEGNSIQEEPQKKVTGRRPVFVGVPGSGEVQKLREKVAQYFKDRKESGLPLTISSLVLYLGTNKQTFKEYVKRFNGHAPGTEFRAKEMEEACQILEDAVAVIEDYYEQQLSLKNNAGGSIFWLKNHGWRDETMVEHAVSEKITGINYITPLPSAEDRYMLNESQDEDGIEQVEPPQEPPQEFSQEKESNYADNHQTNREATSVLSETI